MKTREIGKCPLCGSISTIPHCPRTNTACDLIICTSCNKVVSENGKWKRPIGESDT